MLPRKRWITVNKPCDRLELRQPYSNLTTDVAVNVLTILTSDTHSSSVGLETSLLGGRIICNTLCLSAGLGLYISQSPSRDTVNPVTGDPETFLCRLCVAVSDVLWIRAIKFSDAATSILKIVDAHDPDSLPGAGWPRLIISMSDIAHDRDSSKRATLEFRTQMIQTWRQGPRAGGRYTDLFMAIVKRLEVRAGPPVVHPQRLMFSTRSATSRPVTTVVSQVEQYYLNYPAPIAYVERVKYWPGVDSQAYSGLADWLSFLDGSEERRKNLACVFAQLFYQDGRVVSQDSHLGPEELLVTFYRPLCVKAWREISRVRKDLTETHVQCFLDEVMKQTRSLPTGKSKAVGFMRSIPNPNFCSACLWNLPPLVFFQCGHRICERDVWLHSLRESALDSHCTFESCPVCEAKIEVTLRNRPLQAGYRVLTLDGGGVKGLVELMMIEELLVGLPAKLHPYHYCDVTSGCSTGSLPMTEFGICKLTVKEAKEIYLKAATIVFSQKKGAVAWLPCPVRELLSLIWVFLTGVQYDQSPFRAILGRLCGSQEIRGIGNAVSPEVVRIIIPVTDSQGNLRLIRSYADQDFPNHESLKELRNGIRASCSAPGYFPATEGFVDGAFWANNPSQATQGQLNFISMTKDRMLDFEASFGTGIFDANDQPRSWWRTCLPAWLERLECCFGQMISGTEQYRQHRDALTKTEQERCYRLEPRFHMPAISLDDVKAMSALTEATGAWLETNECVREMKGLRHAILASSFYVVLLETKHCDSGLTSVKLAIVCRWEEDEETKNALRQILCDSYFHISSSAGEFQTIRLAFQTPLTCDVKMRSLNETVDIRLVSENQMSKSISGFPAPISRIRYLQIPNKLLRRPLKRLAEEDQTQSSKRVCVSLDSTDTEQNPLSANAQPICRPRTSVNLPLLRKKANSKISMHRSAEVLSCPRNNRHTHIAVALLGMSTIFWYARTSGRRSKRPAENPSIG